MYINDSLTATKAHTHTTHTDRTLQHASAPERAYGLDGPDIVVRTRDSCRGLLEEKLHCLDDFEQPNDTAMLDAAPYTSKLVSKLRQDFVIPTDCHHGV